MIGLAASVAVFDVPVDPDSGQARQWIIEELSKPPYQAAQPTWFDRLSSAFYDWLSSLNLTGGGGAPVLLIAGIVVVAAIVAAFLIFGPARLNRRSAVAGTLFGEGDERSAADIRSAAENAAARDAWAEAIEEMFRCIARGLAERTVVTTSPGTTAHDFAERAAGAFAAQGERLRAAASGFDDVRYLGRAGTESVYRQLAGLEAELRTTKPVLRDAPVGVTL